MSLTHEHLLSVLHYDPETGRFIWLVSRGKAAAGKIAGCYDHRRRLKIGINNVSYFAHRLAWFYVYGRWPFPAIDHKNCDPSDNRLANLREATFSQNQANHRPKVGTRSGRKGVTYSPTHKRWEAKIKVRGKRYYLGRFDTVEEAAAAYSVTATNAFGEFARTT